MDDKDTKNDIQRILEKCKDLMENEIDKLVQRQKTNGKLKSLKFAEGKIITEYTKTLHERTQSGVISYKSTPHGQKTGATNYNTKT